MVLQAVICTTVCSVLLYATATSVEVASTHIPTLTATATSTAAAVVATKAAMAAVAATTKLSDRTCM
jgi:hypothetical protein